MCEEKGSEMDQEKQNDQDVRNLAKRIFTNRFYGLTKKNRHEKRLGDPIFFFRSKLFFFINCLFSISFGISIISRVITPVGEEEFMELLIFFGGFIVFLWLIYWLGRVFDSGLL